MRGQALHGLYLVVDLDMPSEHLLPALDGALAGGVDVVQAWGRQGLSGPARSTAHEVRARCAQRGVPLLVADDVEACADLQADGVHLEGYGAPRPTPRAVRERLGEDAIVGVTCGADPAKLAWARDHEVDYVSFCSMFPSSSVDRCELVPLPMVGEAKRTLEVPVFASGGITPDNVDLVLSAGADGVAVISAVLGAPDPREAARSFKAALDRAESSRHPARAEPG